MKLNLAQQSLGTKSNWKNQSRLPGAAAHSSINLAGTNKEQPLIANESQTSALSGHHSKQFFNKFIPSDEKDNEKI